MQIASYIANKTFRSFQKSFARSIIYLSIWVTAISLAVMILAHATFNGFQKEIANKVFGFWGHIHITDISANRSIEPIMIQLSDGLLDSIQNLKIRNEKVVEKIQSFIILPAIISKDQEQDGVFLKGITEFYDWNFIQEFMKKGKIIAYSDSTYSRDIILSEQTANRLLLDTGRSIIAHFVMNDEHIKRKLKVCGIYKTGLEEYDKKFGIVDQKLLRSILHKDNQEVTGYEVKCISIHDIENTNDVLYSDILPSQVYSESIRNKFPNIFEWLALQNINKYFILGLILLVCIINMSTTLLILILERTHMVGVLATLGMRIWTQQKIFLHFGARIIFWSLLFGNLIGISLCYLQQKYKLIQLSESDYYLSYAPVDLSFGPLLVLNICFFSVILLCLTIPSLIIRKILPVDAIKFR